MKSDKANAVFALLRKQGQWWTGGPEGEGPLSCRTFVEEESRIFTEYFTLEQLHENMNKR